MQALAAAQPRTCRGAATGMLDDAALGRVGSGQFPDRSKPMLPPEPLACKVTDAVLPSVGEHVEHWQYTLCVDHALLALPGLHWLPAASAVASCRRPFFNHVFGARDDVEGVRACM